MFKIVKLNGVRWWTKQQNVEFGTEQCWSGLDTLCLNHVSVLAVAISTTTVKTVGVKMPQMKLLPGTATLYCVTLPGVIITPLVVSRSDYFRNFVDSCLQKIAQDRPTSDVLLKVRGIKRTV